MLQARLSGRLEVEIEDVPIPPIPNDGALVRIESVGVCGSDIHLYRGIDPWGALSASHTTFGHETAGVIEDLGSHVGNLSVGDHVAIKPMHLYSCGDCSACISGRSTYCIELGIWHGIRSRAAGFSEFEVVAANNLYPVAHDLPFDHACLTDIYACAVHALHHIRSDVSACIIIGTGPIAVSLAQVLQSAGLHVTLIGRSKIRTALIRTINVADEVLCFPDSRAAALSLSSRSAPAVIECVGGENSSTLRMALSAVSPGGWIGVMGAFSGDIGVCYSDAVAKEVTMTVLNGYCSHGIDDFRDAANLLESGAVTPGAIVTERFPLEKVQAALDVFSRRDVDTLKVVVNPQRKFK